MDDLEIEKIRQAVQANKIEISGHAKKRMGRRKIKFKEVVEIILRGEIIEQSARAKPYPKCLILGFVREKDPLYVSCAFNGETVYIITVHWYDPEKWVDPWTRKE
jgi:hypothetical protein